MPLVDQLELFGCVLLDGRVLQLDDLGDPLLLDLVQIGRYYVLLLNFELFGFVRRLFFEFAHLFFTEALVALDPTFLFFQYY